MDAYLEFVGARGAVNTWLATAYDLKVFFEIVGKDPAEVTSADVFAFLGQQRTPRQEKVVRIEDGEAGLSARTIARRLSSIAGLFEYLLVRGDAGVDRDPVPRCGVSEFVIENRNPPNPTLSVVAGRVGWCSERAPRRRPCRVPPASLPAGDTLKSAPLPQGEDGGVVLWMVLIVCWLDCA